MLRLIFSPFSENKKQILGKIKLLALENIMKWRNKRILMLRMRQFIYLIPLTSLGLK
jgi:hypothetical protein